MNGFRPQAFQDRSVPRGTRLVGWAALTHQLGLAAPVRSPRAVADAHIKGSQRTEGDWLIHDKRYWPGDALTDHLSFALRHEPLDLLILKRALEAMAPAELLSLVETAPTGAVSRRAWFFYELLTGRTLPLPDASSVTAVDALDPTLYFTSAPLLSTRHRVRDNLLGNIGFCPLIRRSPLLEFFIARGLAAQAAATIAPVGGHLVSRAASFLLLADSRASFAIENEHPPRNRVERWGRAVLQAGKHELSVDEVNRLHGILIEDNRFVRAGLRPDGVFLGERDHDGDPLPEFIGARPQDLPGMMASLMAANRRMGDAGLDPVLQATATAFGFVYVHPYQDGNGRLHRYLVHHVLAERKFAPPGLVFPVSAVMLDRIEQYRDTLRRHSMPLMSFIEWHPTPTRNVEVTNDTADLYRYIDCTAEAEFLYACVARTIEHDLPHEIDFLRRHEDAQQRIMQLVDVPDRLAQNMILFMRQNGGTLSKNRRDSELAGLTDNEATGIEAIYRDVFGAGASPPR